MKCSDIAGQLMGLLYDELDAEQAAAVKTHLRQCAHCHAEWEQLKATMKIMARWEDISPDRSHLFVEQRISPLEGLKTFFRRHRHIKQMTWSLPAVAAALLILLSLTHFQAEYNNGHWRVAFGADKAQVESQTPEAVATAMKQMQQETLMLVSQILDESETRQKNEISRILAHYATQVEGQRQTDLKLMSQGLEGLHLFTQNRMNQNSKAITDLLELTSYTLERK